jgi:pyruvate dehydrogenase (quinone)
MMFGELMTLHQLELLLEMKAAGLVNFGTDLNNLNSQPWRRRSGMHAQRVWHPDDLADAHAGTAFASEAPALVEVMTARQELSISPAVSLEQVQGFDSYATSAILSGSGDELVDLAVRNVARHLCNRKTARV